MKNKITPPVILLNMAVDVINARENDVIISQYVQRVSDSGAVPMLIPSIEKEENIETLLDLADGVVLIGGRDYDPAEYGEEPHPMTGTNRLRPHFDIAFGKAVLKRNMPVLGICAGCQLLNIITGGKLIQHLDNAESHRQGATHSAKILSDGFFSRAVNGKAGDVLTVNSYHHQALDPEYIGRDIKITAAAFDGSVEAVEIPGERMVLGVQFHPERMDDLGPGFFSLLKEEAEKFSRN
jgi:gamma-glutamyl-gamma-aminobutyrate hydrolase PuuD